MPYPLISIIIPNYNRSHLIQETLESVLQQTYTNWEAIVVDDKSVDESVDVVRQYCKKDARIQLIERDREPAGAPTCRNIGLKLAKGEYVIFLDSDDLLAFDCLEKRVTVVKTHPGIDIFAFPTVRFTNDISNTSSLFYANDTHLGIVAAFILRPQWCICGSLIKKHFLECNNIQFEEGLTKWQDWEFHLQVLIKGAKCLRGYEIPDVYLRQHNDVNRIDNLANKVNPNHISILELLRRIYNDLVNSIQYGEEEREALFCRCYELSAFLINSRNFSLAQKCVVFMYEIFSKHHLGRLRQLSFWVKLINRFSTIPKLKTAVYLILIRNLNYYKKKMIVHVPNS